MPPKVTGRSGKAQKTPSSGTQQPNQKKNEKGKDEVEKDKLIKNLETENMLLRKNLDIKKLMDELRQKGCREENMIGMFQDTLHQLELKLKEYEAGDDKKENKKDIKWTSNAEQDLENKIEKLKTALNEKSSKIAELEKEVTKAKSDVAKENSTSKDQFEDLKQRLENELKEQKIEAEKEANGLKNQLRELEQRLKSKEDENLKLQRDLDTFPNKAEKHKTTEKKDTSHPSSSEAEEKLNDANRRIAEAERKLKEVNDKLQQKEEELKKSTETNSNLQKEINEKLKEMNDKLQQKEEELKKTTETNSNLQKEINELKEMNDKLQQKDDELKKGTENSKRLEKQMDDKYMKENSELKNKLDEFKKKEEEYKITMDKKNKEIEKLLTEKSNLSKPRGSTGSAKREKYDDVAKELSSAREEISDLKNRLSKVVGAKVMDANPNITDLSDENRPTKLAEKYSELYDNEWTNAYEEAEKEMEEAKIIENFYNLLIKIHKFCHELAAAHLDSIQKSVMIVPSDTRGNLSPTEMSVTNTRLLKELRKSVAPNLVDSVYQTFTKKHNVDMNGKPEREKFAKACVRICWLMSSQDPPVVLDTADSKGLFNGDKFRTYTKSGKHVDFVVWPPMLLHEDGPLLSKGVSQGK